MSFAGIRAQDVAVDILERAVDADRVASSYLFEGPSGVGKQRTALALARRLIGGDPTTDERIVEGHHPDVRVFEPRGDGRRNIQVETLREEILPIAQFAPFEASAAFLIFPEADVSFPEHPPESANALLKTLEEPRPGVHFVLLSERPDRLLPTIRSRCQRVRFGRLPMAVIDDILRAHEVDEAQRGPAVALADGRADRALALADGGAQALLEQALAIDEVATTGGPGSLVRTAEDLARGDTDLATVLEALTTFYRDVAAAALGLPDEALAFRHRAGLIRERAARLSAATAAARVELIQEATVALERNGNPQIVLDALLYGARV
ncbi:MAG TPA: DNA polymerase III subunit [Sandaracinaceae bacterium LLY-WYZ-13_1]|nr:DNA polymerase III subunit [Sandaracinaceae bacterium LLY-WYZ-13_1]